MGIWAVSAGCVKDSSPHEQAKTKAMEAKILAKWGKLPADLPESELLVLSPHNRDIEFEFEFAFNLHHALEYGTRVRIEWISVGGGASQMYQYLTNVYDQPGTTTSGIDVLFGGGDYVMAKLARRHHEPDQPDVLQPLQLSKDVLANIPTSLAGNPMLDQDHLWAAAAVSGFGILYNQTLLKQLDIAPPKTWDDLAEPRFHQLLALADPSLSGSVAATFVLIVQSEDDWPTGWTKLHGMLGNAMMFTRGAGDAANAVVFEAPVATAIDFYGFMRVNMYPEDLVYTPPAGQAIFTADPIAILRNPPHPELAQRFVEFVLGEQGQALWALPVGAPDGPVRRPLLRQPVRKDIYADRYEQFLPSIANPYKASTPRQNKIPGLFNVIRNLVATGPVSNADAMRRARTKLLREDNPAALVAIWNELPANLRTAEDVTAVDHQLRDAQTAEALRADWQEFFRRKYQRILEH